MLTPITPGARRARRVGWLPAALLVLAASAAVRAQDDTDPGRVLAVAAPVTSDTAGRLREAITDALKRAEARRGQRVFKVILDFNPENKANSSKDFGHCYEVAKLLRGLQGQGVRTVAFVHAKVTGHSVLPVLACSEIVFSKSGELGEIVRDPNESLAPAERLAYDDVTRSRRPLALVRKMYDRDLVVVRTPDGQGERYRDAREAKAGEPVLLS
ncbi:MAG TPA: hypothetical protein VKW77_05300, partial [Acidimicrobiales bacterium]|nr:hypothetical protein [Acidimicrobiales bacterium]